MCKRTYFTILALVLAALSYAQDNQRDKVVVSGSVQSDMLIPQSDKDIGAEKIEDFQTNTYVDLKLQHRLLEGGLRMEYLDHPLPGFDDDGFKGWGVPHFYLKGKLGKAELTAGTFYEQFGSGFILRAYEERTLGIDNSLLGGRLSVKPLNGVTLKVLGGKQRRYWKWNDSFISGADAEVCLNDWFPEMIFSGTRLTLGASWVNKYEKQEDVYLDLTHRLNVPEFVNSWDVRANLSIMNWNLLAEYARKTDDPSYQNGYIYRPGSAAMISTSYSRKGMSILLQAKRSENMASLSKRSEQSLHSASAINYLPAFTTNQTYALAALYPYATQMADGEWAYQAELGYNFKRYTPLGGKYGMMVKVNYSYIRAIDRKFRNNFTGDALGGHTMLAGTDGYTSKFFKWGDQTYYQDLDIQLSRKFSKAFKLNLMYMNQRYNQAIIERHGGMVHSNIFVADGKYQFSPKTTLRVEAQYLSTKDDEGDWLFGLAELSLAPHWMITVSDMWNVGDINVSQHPDDANTHYHYYQALLTYNVGNHRIQAGYGRTREGINCSGGVCRVIPAQKGFTLSYNYNF